MKKKMILRGVGGFPQGVALGYFITILVSFIWGNGYYAPCMPGLVSMMGSEINAVILQALLCGLVGSGFAAASVIWEMEHWSIVKQTGIYFSIVSIIMMPIAYLAHWMEHSMIGFFIYFGIFVLLFLIIWIVQFIAGMRNVRKMNENLKNKAGRE